MRVALQDRNNPLIYKLLLEHGFNEDEAIESMLANAQVELDILREQKNGNN